MKRAMFVVVAGLTTIMVGCQDDQIMSPVTKDMMLSTQQEKMAPSPEQGRIPIAALLKDPVNTPALVQISGLITYDFPEDKSQKEALEQCHIVINAELWPAYQARCGWTVSAESLEKFVLVGSGSTTFTRRYSIRGRSDGVFLRVTYNLTAQQLKVESLSLETIVASSPDKDGEVRVLPQEDESMKAACKRVVTIDKVVPFTTIETNPVDPYPMARVFGTVTYSFSPSPLPTSGMFTLTLMPDVTLRPLNGVDHEWSFHSISTEVVYVSAKEPTILSKEYVTVGYGWRVFLHIEYEVRNNSVEPRNIWSVRQSTAPPLPATM